LFLHFFTLFHSIDPSFCVRSFHFHSIHPTFFPTCRRSIISGLISAQPHMGNITPSRGYGPSMKNWKLSRDQKILFSKYSEDALSWHSSDSSMMHFNLHRSWCVPVSRLHILPLWLTFNITDSYRGVKYLLLSI
jgi:hypothetical protein